MIAIDNTFMIIDDDKGFRSCISSIIKKYHLGVILASCGDGLEAESLIRAYRPAVVVIDLLLPGQSGIEVTKKLAAARDETAFIMVSACSNPALIAQAYYSGVDFYLPKPVNVLDFIAVVTKASKSKEGTLW